MEISQNNKLFRVALVLPWVGATICCAFAMIAFYGLLGNRILFPFKTHADQIIAVSQTALAATVISSWAMWFGARGKPDLKTVLLRTGVGTQLSLTLFAVTGLLATLLDRHSPLDLVFHSTFFAEYNWLTFIFEVAPLTSIAACLLLYFCLRMKRKSL